MVFKVKPKAATAAAVIKDGTYRATVSNLKQFANTYGERQEGERWQDRQPFQRIYWCIFRKPFPASGASQIGASTRWPVWSGWGAPSVGGILTMKEP